MRSASATEVPPNFITTVCGSTGTAVNDSQPLLVCASRVQSVRWAALLAAVAALLVLFLAGNSSHVDSGQAAAASCPDANRTGRFIEKVSVEGVQRTAV